MMHRKLAGAFALLITATASCPATARVVDYTLPPAAMIAAGQELKIAPITTEPRPHTHIANLSSEAAADHVNLALALFCSAYKVENPVSKLFEAVRDEWNSAGEANRAISTPINLRIETASSNRRCVEVSEMNLRCITKVKISGTTSLAAAGSDSAPIRVAGEAERDSSVGGLCGNMAKGVGVVSREAAFALLSDAESKLGVTQ